MAECRFRMIQRGDPYIPRSCPNCGLGGCKLGLPDPYRPPGQPPTPEAVVQAVLVDLMQGEPPGGGWTLEASAIVTALRKAGLLHGGHRG